MIGPGVQLLLDSVLNLDQDTLWSGAAVTIMLGLSFGNLLTIIVVPALFSTPERLYL
jgi:multidrug efflux pump subunit AcrB